MGEPTIFCVGLLFAPHYPVIQEIKPRVHAVSLKTVLKAANSTISAVVRSPFQGSGNYDFLEASMGLYNDVRPLYSCRVLRKC